MFFTNKPCPSWKWALFGFVLLTCQIAQSQMPSNAATHQEIRLLYQSELENYQRYSPTTINAWSQSNQIVEQLGGWKTYSKEGTSKSTDSNKSKDQPHQMHHEMPTKREQGVQQ